MLGFLPITIFLESVIGAAKKYRAVRGYMVSPSLFEPIKIPEDRLEDGYAHDHKYYLNNIFRLQDRALVEPASHPSMPGSELPWPGGLRGLRNLLQKSC